MPERSDQPAPCHLKRLREAHGLSLDVLAERAGLTPAFVSKIERGATVPSLASARRLADAFGIGIGELFGAEPDEQSITLVRRDARQPFTLTGRAAGHRHEAIALAARAGQFEAVIDHPPFERATGHRPAAHGGSRFIFVVKGRVEVTFPHRAVRLGPGDALMFDAQVPHCVLSLRPRQAEILVIVTPEAPAEGTAAAGW